MSMQREDCGVDSRFIGSTPRVDCGTGDYNSAWVNPGLTGNKQMLSQSLSHLSSQNLPFVEKLLEEYESSPASVPPPWREYFDRLKASVL